MTSILGTTCFNLGVLGARLTHDFSTRIAELGISHKQVGILALIDADTTRSQRQLAEHLRVAPSLIVALLDQLTAIGAITRKRSDTDRRVHVITLTETGKDLLNQAEAIAYDLDHDFRSSLPTKAQKALDMFLAEIQPL